MSDIPQSHASCIAEVHDIYPEEAIKCSSSAINMLNVLHGKVEEARDLCKYPVTLKPVKETLTIATVLSSSVHYPRDMPFWHCYPEGEDERFSIVLTTDPLVQNTAQSSIPRLKCGDIGSEYTMSALMLDPFVEM